MGRGRSWLEDARLRTVAEVVANLDSFELDANGAAFGPCPACDVDRRNSPDRRADPRGRCVVLSNGGWKCYSNGSDGCGAQGDALSLVVWALTGWSQRELHGADDWSPVRSWYAARGWCAPELGAPPPPRVKPRPAPPPAEEKPPPPAEEVATLWAACGPVTADGEVSAWLRSRSLDPGAVEALDLARALPVSARQPGWARIGDHAWAEAGYRCILPAWNHRGELATLRARSCTGREPKDLAPLGYSMRGCVLAERLGRQLLTDGGAPDWWPPDAPLRMVIAEGAPDFLTWATERADDPYGPAVLGLWAGAWTPEIAARVPDGAAVVVWTDDNDAGHRYADGVRSTLTPRCGVMRGKVT